MNIDTTVIGINAVDVFIALVMATVVFIGKNEGVVAGFVKLFGVCCTIFITLHYYVRLADYLRVRFLGEDAAPEFFVFGSLAVLMLLVFVLICRGWVLMLKVKLHPAVDRWGGLALALTRSYFLCGLIFLALLLSEHDYAVPRARRSVSRLVFGNAAAGLYKASYALLVEKFFPGEGINGAVFELMEETPDEK